MNENNVGNFQLSISLKEVFAFTDHQESATHGLGYSITLKKILIRTQ